MHHHLHQRFSINCSWIHQASVVRVNTCSCALNNWCMSGTKLDFQLGVGQQTREHIAYAPSNRWIGGRGEQHTATHKGYRTISRHVVVKFVRLEIHKFHLSKQYTTICYIRMLYDDSKCSAMWNLYFAKLTQFAAMRNRSWGRQHRLLIGLSEDIMLACIRLCVYVKAYTCDRPKHVSGIHLIKYCTDFQSRK